MMVGYKKKKKKGKYYVFFTFCIASLKIGDEKLLVCESEVCFLTKSEIHMD